MASFLRKFLTNFAWVSTGSTLSTLINFVSSLLIVLNISVFDYGLLVLSLSVVGILGLFLTFGLGPVISSDIAQELGKKRVDRAKEMLFSYARLTFTMGVIIASLLFLFSDNAADFLSRPEVSWLLQIAALMLFLEGITYFVKTAFQASMHFKYLSIMGIVESISRFALILGFISLGAFDLGVAFLCYPLSLAASALVASVFLVKSMRIYKGVKPTKEGLLKKIAFGHGKFIIIQQPFKTVADNAPVWIIEFLLGVTAVGIYAIARRVYSFIRIYLGSIENVLIPSISYEFVRNKARVRRIFTRGVKYGFFVSSVFLLLAVISIGPMLSFLGLEKYYPSIPVFKVIVLNLLIVSVSYLFRPLFFALKAQKELMIMYIISTFSLILLLFVFVSMFQSPVGTAVAIVLNGAIFVFVGYWVLVRLDPGLGLGWKDLRIDDYDKDLFKKLLRGGREGLRFGTKKKRKPEE